MHAASGGKLGALLLRSELIQVTNQRFDLRDYEPLGRDRQRSTLGQRFPKASNISLALRHQPVDDRIVIQLSQASEVAQRQLGQTRDRDQGREARLLPARLPVGDRDIRKGLVASEQLGDPASEYFEIEAVQALDAGAADPRSKRGPHGAQLDVLCGKVIVERRRVFEHNIWSIAPAGTLAVGGIPIPIRAWLS